MGKLLTITIPTYKTEQYLPRCIESLIVSNYLNKLEILIIIDGSPDNSADVARCYQTQYPDVIKVIEKTNGGHGSTINKGIELATGKYFRVLDSDDWFDSDQFAHFLEKLEKLDVDMVLTPSTLEYVYENRSVSLVFDKVEYEREYDADSFDYSNFVYDKLNTMARTTYKTHVLRESKLQLPKHTFYVDVLYSLCVMAYVKNFIFINNNIYHYFIGRPEQSVNNYCKNIVHLRTVICLSINCINSQSVHMNDNKNHYLFNEIKARICQFNNVYFFHLPFKQVYPEIELIMQHIEQLNVQHAKYFTSEMNSYKRYIFAPFLYVFIFRLYNKILRLFRLN